MNNWTHFISNTFPANTHGYAGKYKNLGQSSASTPVELIFTFACVAMSIFKTSFILSKIEKK